MLSPSLTSDLKFFHFFHEVNNVDDMLDDEGEDESDNKDGEKKDFPCDQCPKKFKTAWRLRQHLIAHARREEMKKYECDKCAATFISEWQLKRHAKIHNGQSTKDVIIVLRFFKIAVIYGEMKPEITKFSEMKHWFVFLILFLRFL